MTSTHPIGVRCASAAEARVYAVLLETQHPGCVVTVPLTNGDWLVSVVQQRAA